MKSALVNSVTLAKKIKKTMINNKKYGVIDVGSNSVRAILYSGGNILFKSTLTTRLGEGLSTTGFISVGGFERTLQAVKTLVFQLIGLGADEILPFATEAVRSAKNGLEFTLEVKKKVGLDVDVLSGEVEGEIGLLGALNGGDGGVIDVGGASAEIVVANGGKIVYSHSLPLGAVRLYESCGESEELLNEIMSKRLPEYGKVPQYVDYYAVGGTASTLAFIDSGLENYDDELINGRLITLDTMRNLRLKISDLSVLERVENLKINKRRAEVIKGGAFLLEKIMETFNIPQIVVSTNDNLVGYLKKKVFGEGYAKN